MITAIPIRRNRKRAGPFVLLALALCVLVACAAGGCKDEPPPRSASDEEDRLRAGAGACSPRAEDHRAWKRTGSDPAEWSLLRKSKRTPSTDRIGSGSFQVFCHHKDGEGRTHTEGSQDQDPLAAVQSGPAQGGWDHRRWNDEEGTS